MISLLNLINDNILSLTSFLKDRALLGDEDGKDRGKARFEDEMATDITYTILDQEVHKMQQQEAEENRMAYEVAQVMQELEKKNED